MWLRRYLASEPRSVLNERVYRAWLIMGAFGLGAIAAAAVLAWFQARRLARPVDELRKSVNRLGEGDFTVRATPTGVPEIDDAGQALDVAAERLGSLIDRERAFSADASHQLRTPITTLRLGIETALADPRMDPREALEEALEDTDHLVDTVQELLALAADTPAERDPWPLDGLLDEIEERWHGPLARQGRPFRVQHATDDIQIASPRAAAAHVLDALVDNAARHGAGTVTLSVRSVAGGLTLVVEDEGTGIDGDAERLFERRSSGAQGNGIGLAMARRMAEAAVDGSSCAAPSRIRRSNSSFPWHPLVDAGGSAGLGHPCRQYDDKVGTGTFPVPYRDRAVVRLDDVAGDGEPESGTTTFAIATFVDVGEPLEHPVAFRRRDPRTVVADHELHDAGMLRH